MEKNNWCIMNWDLHCKLGSHEQRLSFSVIKYADLTNPLNVFLTFERQFFTIKKTYGD